MIKMMSSTIDNISTEIILTANPEINIKTVLESFCEGDDAVYLLQNFDSEQIIELLKIILEEMNIHPEYGNPILKSVYYEDSDIISYIDVFFDACDWDEWKELELEFLSKETSIKGKVAVTCIKGLIE
jgi:hypothetical protein